MSSVPAERLAQIAVRKLNALRIPARIHPEVASNVEGAFAFTPGRVVHPLTQVPIGRARFRVVGHDRLQFVEAPLSALEPTPFYDAPTLEAVEHAIAAALQRRGELLRASGARFERMRLKPTLDPNTLSARVRIEGGEAVFHLESDPAGTWVRSLVEGGREVVLDRPQTTLNLDEFPLGVDLELHLSDRIDELRKAQSRASGARDEAQSSRVMLDDVAPGPNVLTVGQLGRAFGPGVVIIPGDRVQVRQEFMAGPTRYSFVAIHEAGATFRAQLVGPRGPVWQDRIDIERFPGTRSFVAATLGLAPSTAAPLPASPATPSEARPAHPPPSLADANLPTVHVGEIWVMRVLVEAESDRDVRYVCMNPDGQPYGAARILPKPDFMRVFSEHRGSWRLRIAIEAVNGAQVTYRQLDPSGNRAPQAKTLHASALASAFLPEAQDY